jgi:hypothetical protein
MTREGEMSNAQIAEKIGYLRRQLAVVGLALDALRPKHNPDPGLDGIEELVFDVYLKLGQVENQIHPEPAERTEQHDEAQG